MAKVSTDYGWKVPGSSKVCWSEADHLPARGIEQRDRHAHLQ